MLNVDFSRIFFGSLSESVKIILIILVLMVLVELFVLKFKDKIMRFVDKNIFLSYLISSFFGIIPGCVGTFAMDSLYMSGLLGFGGIVAVMIATSGDEAFLMLSAALKGDLSWQILLLLTLVLFVMGILGGFIADFLRKKSGMRFCEKCRITFHKKDEFRLKHFIKEHIYNHIIKKHIWKIFLWLWAALFFISFLQDVINVDFTGGQMVYILIIAALVGVLPISGPNLFLFIMFMKGLVPFSVLLTNSIIQDGHGLLPIIGFSLEDAFKIKLFNFIFGLAVGLAVLALGF